MIGRRLVVEGLGTAILVATVVGSGIMAQRLAGGNLRLTDLKLETLGGHIAADALIAHLDATPDVGQITLACMLGYRDFRFNGSWRGDHSRLVAWLDNFSARVPAFAATKPAS